VALLIEGVARGFLPRAMHKQIALPIVVLAIGFSGRVRYARTVRGSVLVERNRKYVQAAWIMGISTPPTRPSLGTTIRLGNDFLFSGQWWIKLFPSLMLAIQILAINLLGDWLRDALNPKLRGR
jgi:peptide/nickel transport system permease protein